jgi:hypothetical protein
MEIKNTFEKPARNRVNFRHEKRENMKNILLNKNQLRALAEYAEFKKTW